MIILHFKVYRVYVQTSEAVQLNTTQNVEKSAFPLFTTHNHFSSDNFAPDILVSEDKQLLYALCQNGVVLVLCTAFHTLVKSIF